MKLKNKIQQTIASHDMTKVVATNIEVRHVNLKKSGEITGRVNGIGKVNKLSGSVWLMVS